MSLGIHTVARTLPFLKMIYKMAIVMAMFAFCFSGCSSKEEMVRVSLEWTRLGPLPVPQEKVEAATIGNQFSRRFYLKFKATPQEINEWIQRCPGLQGVEPFSHSEKKMYLPYAEADLAAMDDIASHNFFAQPKQLPWFNPTIRIKGRRFEIPQDKDACGGTLVIDDISNVVYITAARS